VRRPDWRQRLSVAGTSAGRARRCRRAGSTERPAQYRKRFRRPDSSSLPAACGPLGAARPQPPRLRALKTSRATAAAVPVSARSSCCSSAIASQTGHSGTPCCASPLPTTSGIAAEQAPARPPGRGQAGARGGGPPRCCTAGQVVEAMLRGRCGSKRVLEHRAWGCRPGARPVRGLGIALQGRNARNLPAAPVSGRARPVAQRFISAIRHWAATAPGALRRSAGSSGCSSHPAEVSPPGSRPTGCPSAIPTCRLASKSQSWRWPVNRCSRVAQHLAARTVISGGRHFHFQRHAAGCSLPLRSACFTGLAPGQFQRLLGPSSGRFPPACSSTRARAGKPGHLRATLWEERESVGCKRPLACLCLSSFDFGEGRPPKRSRQRCRAP